MLVAVIFFGGAGIARVLINTAIEAGSSFFDDLTLSRLQLINRLIAVMH